MASAGCTIVDGSHRPRATQEPGFLTIRRPFNSLQHGALGNGTVHHVSGAESQDAWHAAVSDGSVHWDAGRWQQGPPSSPSGDLDLALPDHFWSLDEEQESAKMQTGRVTSDRSQILYLLPTPIVGGDGRPGNDHPATELESYLPVPSPT